MADPGRDSLSLDVDRDQVAWITFDSPESKVNLFTSPTMEELDQLLSSLESRVATGKIVAVVFRSGKEGGYVAGADVNEIAELRSADEAREKSREGQRIFRRVDRLTVPTIAAIDGTCLGAGTELALACSHRIASDHRKTEIGLPETKLGILPGFGGTVRLPRICALRSALRMILSGSSVSAAEAHRMGLVDEVLPAEDFEGATSDFVRRLLTGEVEKSEPERSFLQGVLEDTAVGRRFIFAMARKKTRERTEGRYPAPLRALEVIEETRGMPIDAALEIEAEALGELATTEVSRNLVRIFLLSRGAGRVLSEEELRRGGKVEKLGVLGAGVMGGAIAELAAVGEVDVLLKDVEQDAVDSGMRHARDLLRSAASKGVFSEEEAGLKFARIEGTLSYEGFDEVDLVIEAVVERMAVKKQVLREVEERLRDDAVFATNTSSLSVEELSGAARRPERVVGLHFFNPVHKMPLVEVVRTDETSEEALATAFGFVRDMDKTPVIIADAPGFLVNRLLGPYLNEAGYLLAEGSGVRDIDETLTDFGMPMGPCRLLDEVGLDVAGHVSEEMTRAFGERMRPSDAIPALLEDGRLGKKNGLGFYIYRNGEARRPDPAIEPLLSRRDEGDRAPGPAEIRRRCLYPMVSEAARALEEDVVRNAGDVDLAMITGTGFPPFRGGLLRWADREGLPEIVETLRAFTSRLGPRFRPAPLLERLAENDRSFTDPLPL